MADLDAASLLAALDARGCGACWKCEPSYQFMRLCPTCGNKRCPHATDHDNPCSGSNDTGQVGSIYELRSGEAPARRFEAFFAAAIEVRDA